MELLLSIWTEETTGINLVLYTIQFTFRLNFLIWARLSVKFQTENEEHMHPVYRGGGDEHYKSYIKV